MKVGAIVINASEQINAVRRVVGGRTLAAGEARVATVSQTYNAGIDDVWDACTNPERLPRWFLPISGDLRVGGHYQLQGNAGGTVERCEAPNSFGATWEYGGDVSWIEVRLARTPDGGTLFTLEHTGSVDDAKWAEFGPGAIGVGWDMTLTGLAMYLASGEPNDADRFMAWMMSDDGKQFLTSSSLRWRDANIEAGTDPDAANAAAERTTAAYTAVPAEG
jgi:uncharacterized protein YndB with AHSA1/START domain